MTRVALIGPADRDEIQRLALRLEERDAEAVIVDTRRPAAIVLDGKVEEACGQSLADVSAVYVGDLGLPSPGASDGNGSVDVAASRAALRHSQATWAAWLTLFERVGRHAAIVNPPASWDVHGLKPFEIGTYRARGLRAPLTLSTDDDSAFLELGARPLAHGRVRKDVVGGYGYTERLEPPSDLAAARAVLRESALMAQERIEGDAVRAFVVGERVVVAAEILTQTFGEVDSRRGGARVRRIELPGKVAEAAIAVAQHWGMSFAGVDWMRSSTSREWVLLECNSSPFFVVLERCTGVDIGSAIADLLLRRTRRPRQAAASVPAAEAAPPPVAAQAPASEKPGPYATPLLNRLWNHARSEVDPDYDFLAFTEVPWAPPRAPVRELCVALVTTANLHRRGDTPFTTLESTLGDTSFRVIPHGLPEAELDLEAPYVDQKYIPRDPEVALPRRALDELAAQGFIASAAPRHYSFAQGIVHPLPDLAERAREVAQLLAEDRVDALVLLPTCSLCVQTAGVLAREFETAGFSTVALTALPELTARIGVPRALSTRFPFGAAAGDPGNRALHLGILREALGLVARAREPRTLAESGLRWRSRD